MRIAPSARTLGLLVALALGPAPAALAARIHLVVAADTLDPKIGKNVAVDLRDVESVFRANVPKATGILSVTTLSGANCHPDAIRAAVSNLPVGPDDAVVVFYQGHGAYDAQAGHYLQFPRLGNAYLTRADLVARVKGRGARLGVIATDCCNKLSMLPRNVPPSMGMPMAGAPEPEISPLFRALFLDVAGFVDLTSSRRGEESISYPAKRDQHMKMDIYGGGLFTSAVVGVLRGGEQVLTWDELADRASRSVAAAFRRLKPDGLDNPDEPEKPQMTQTVVAAVAVRPIRGPRRPGQGQAPPIGPFDPDEGSTSSQRLGILGFENSGQGIFVYATTPGGPAARLGLEQGDVILAVNDNTIRTARGYQRTIAQAEGAVSLAYRDVRTGQVRSAVVNLDGQPYRFRGRGQPREGPDPFGVNGSEVGGGVRVDSVVPNSPAARLMLDPGDLITAVNGRPVRTLSELGAAVDDSPDEMWFDLVNIRTGKPQAMILTLDRPGEKGSDPVPPIGRREQNLTLGVHGFENSGQGIYVYATRPGSPAARLGLERNDLILSIDGQPIADVAQYRRALSTSGGSITLGFRDVRTGQVKSVPVQLDSHGPVPPDPGGRSIFGAVGVAVQGGVMVQTVYANSAAHLAGVDPGDVIVSINGAPIRTLAEYLEAVRASPDEMAFVVRNVKDGQLLGMVVQLDR